MRRYRKILAGVLAASLVISGMPMDVQAKSAYQEHTSTQIVSQDYTVEENIDDADENPETEDVDDTTSASMDTELNTEDIISGDDEVDDTDSDEDAIEVNTGDTSESKVEKDDDTQYDESLYEDEQSLPDEAQFADVYSGDSTATLAVVEGTLNLTDLVNDTANTGILCPDATTISASNADAIILLSNCVSSDVKDKNITLNISGTVDLTKSVTWNGKTYKYTGICTESIPYSGSFSTNAELIIDSTLFGGITSDATISIEKITWKGNGTVPMYAEKYIFNDTEEHKLSVSLSATSNAGAVQQNAVMGSLIGNISGENGNNGTLTIDGDKIKYTSKSTGVNVAGNAGFICGTLGDGCTVKLTNYSFPAGVSGTGATASTCEVKSNNGGNAGGLIGEMGENSKLYVELASSATITGMSVTTAGSGAQADDAAILGNAGGITGYAASGAAIDIISANGLILSGTKITGIRSAGGVAGCATNIELLGGNAESKLTISGGTIKETDKNEGSAGGAFGIYNSNSEMNAKLSSRLEVGSDEKSRITVVASAETGDAGSANGIGDPSVSVQVGGLIGMLSLNASTYEISDKTIYVGVSGSERSYGGLIGHAVSNSLRDNTLLIKNSTANSTYVKYAYFHGGIIGELGQTGEDSKAVYLEVEDTTAVVSNPWAGRDGNIEDSQRGFGGIVARVAEKSILKLSGKNVVETTGSDKYAWQGGGVVGWAADGSAVEFNGITDLSKTYIKQRYFSGALIAGQGNALIYAHGDGNGTNNGWKYIRTNNTNDSAVDDIGNYGQVLRLKMADNEKNGLPVGFITIDEKHNVQISQVKDGYFSGNSITLNDTEQFAQLAVTWQSQGFFSADKNITHENWDTINNKNITLGGDVDLTGTGITGLTRDSAEFYKNGAISIPDTFDEYTYNGSFDGQDRTVTLAIGEAYGYRGESPVKDGDKESGIVYGHAYNGIFAVVTGDVKNITIKGKIYISGHRWDQYNSSGTRRDIMAGGYAAQVYSSNGVVSAENVTIGLEEHIDDEDSDKVSVYAGGLYGCIKQDCTIINLGSADNPVVSNTKIIIGDSTTEKYVYAGGLVGTVSDYNITVNCEAVKLSGSIAHATATGKVTNLQAGGLIGWINYNSLKKRIINLKSVVIDGQTITSTKATANGGLLGYMWADTIVNFETPSGTADYALQIDGATINVSAPDAAVGGLVYRASGKWTINDRAIKMNSATFAVNGAKDALGLLVCHGGNESSSKKRALYMEMTENWKTSYVIDSNNVKVSASSDMKIYDEFVAYTVMSGGTGGGADNIMRNDINGVISLATEGHKGVAIGKSCNTYVNRTEYGQQHQINAYSRYYYNLDSIKTEISTQTANNDADSPQKLLMWSVWVYASASIKDEFKVGGVEKITRIGQYSSGSKAYLDMKGLSYYPIDRGNTPVMNAKIKFYNADIETYEDKGSNKKTSDTSQHYKMHFGLFNDYTGKSTVTVSNVSLSGSIGRSDDGSGILYCGSISGSDSTKMQTVTVNGLTLEGLIVTNAGNDYAPVLINSIGGYTSFSISNVRTNYTDNATAAGSSLIGRVGSGSSDTMITGNFSDIKLPDKAYGIGDGIFTHSTFLESFQYRDGGVASIVYNFNKAEDWGESGSDHVHYVTYGKEISDSTQYANLQRWYYDKEGYNTDSGRVRFDMNGTLDDTSVFSSYLPYVYSKYNISNRYYEIVVNQRMSDFITGCGTYGHPYVVTDPLELSSIAAYIATKSAKKGWKIRITADQAVYHTDNDSTDTDIVYLCDGENWKETEYNETTKDWVEKNEGTEISNDLMHDYMLSAYYDIQASSNSDNVLTLSDFAGLGTEDYAFRGVIVSTKGSTVKLTGDAGNGFIRYSYGSVLKDITIKYSGAVRNLTYNSTTDGKSVVESLKPADASGTKYSPAVFWGGAIGCILGGDNIIDNVNVTFDDSWSLVLDGDVNYLIETGGYVGSVAGGGVIFRNMSASNNNLTVAKVKKGSATESSEISVIDENKSFYVNPYVGRVLDGYAFSENCVINNGNKNYKINELKQSDDKDITTVRDDNKQFTTTIKNAQGLLVFSAIVNSGAAAGGDRNNNGTMAYSGLQENYNKKGGDNGYSLGNGIYGKVRNASYKYVGGIVSGNSTVTGVDETVITNDFEISKKDDMYAPGCTDINTASLDDDTNAPYLVRTYSNDMTYYVSAWNGSSYSKLTIVLADNATYDMGTYGLGYQGITARYTSSAIKTSDSSKDWGASYVKPLITGFKGNSSTITNVNMEIKEYAYDDFHAASVGGIFNLIRTPSSSELADSKLAEDLNITSSTVSLTYYLGSGTTTTAAFNNSDSITSQDLGYMCVGVGGFAGNSSQNGLTSYDDAKYIIDKIALTNVKVSGPITAGGIMGSTAMGNSTLNYNGGLMFRNREKSYNYFGANLVDCTYTDLTVSAGYFAGGFVGYAGNNENQINNNVYTNKSTTNKLTSSLTVTDKQYSSVGKNATIKTSCANTPAATVSAAGGMFGALVTKLYINKESSIPAVFTNITAEAKDTTINNKATSYNVNRYADAGSVIGHIANSECSIRYVEVINDESTNYVNGWADSGGLVGCINSDDRKISIENCKVTNTYIKDSYLNSGALVGGFYLISGNETIVIKNCELNKVNVIGLDSVGGFVGCNRGSQPIQVEGCTAVEVKINDDDSHSKKGWNGLILGSMGDASAMLYLYDTVMKDCVVKGSYVGGISSSLHKIVYGSNILMDNITVSGTGKKGLLFGEVESSYQKLYLAGLSIKNCSGRLNEEGKESAGKLNLGSKGYIAFADYINKAQDASVTHSTSLFKTDAVSPYVVTSPENADSEALKLYEENGTATNPVSPEYLYGDSVSWSKKTSGGFDMLGEQILEESVTETDTTGGRYKYSNISDDAKDFDFVGNFSTYNANQTNKVTNDFPVLQISGGETGGIEKYLDIITNGGYSQAKNCSAVTIEKTVYKYTEGKFVKSLTEESPLTIQDNGKSTMGFVVSSDYDNDKDRFTLLSVEFKPNPDNEHIYYVHVPVIVRRVLDVDFTATLSYGTHFNSEYYKDLTGHILDSFGNPMTGYLTYTYGSSFGTQTDYGWQNYVDAGGDVAQTMEKKIRFVQSDNLPVGTQLTLVDCQDDKKTAYYYTVSGKETDGKEFSFGDFVSAGGDKFSSGSIGERIGITIKEAKNGNFIEVQKDGRPLNAGATDTTKYPAATVTKDGKYYRIKTTADKVTTTTKLYSVEMAEKTYTENYYLVITMKDTGDDTLVANGYVITSFDGTIPYQLHYMRRKEQDEDGHSNTASTYQISSGYRQVLTESLTGTETIKLISAADSKLKVSVKDEITFPNRQAYTPSDELYQRFIANLQVVRSGTSGSTSVTYTQFPSGTSGNVKFYVYTVGTSGTGTSSTEQVTYYTYDTESSSWGPAQNKTAATEYEWTSTGGNMELILSEDGTLDKAISLQSLRNRLKGGNISGNSTFYIEAIMEPEIPTLGLDVIPESSLVNGVPENYAKLNYVAQLSTEKGSLAYSNTRATYSNTRIAYYQEATQGSKLTYNADNINQLGINLLDLDENLDKDKTHSIIATTAVYDLHEIKNLESMLKTSDHMEFTLSISRKNETDGNTESYIPIGDDAASYISVEVTSENAGNIQCVDGKWSWKIPKSSYIDVNTGSLKTSGIFDGNNITQAINLLVNIDNVESLKHFYANYNVELSVKIVDEKGNILDKPDSDNIIYTLTRIKPEFVESN